ncbi:hypothetical protein BHE74_00002376 [Ensete ventricosum]|nr:hypothetical protein BHE74_00002376 [Ensete ventricosum]RZR81942.1 hypothetical protein BHM03_00008252 [Ensete ventricosum]
MRITPRPTTYKPSTPFAPSHLSLQKKFTREELCNRSAKGLCWHCDESWSHDHHCKKGCLLVIEPIEDSEEVQEYEEVTEEEQQLVDCMMHALAGYANLQMMKVGGPLRQQPISVFIDTGSKNNFMNNKVAARIALHIEDYSRFDVKVTDSQIFNCDRRCPRVKLLLQDQ